jgi:hypothetical protein
MTFKNILFLSFLFFYGFVLILGLSFDWHYIWSHTGINFTSNTFPFGDIQSIANYSEYKSLGLNPRTDMMVNDSGRIIPKFNYPLVWSYLSVLGIKDQHTLFLGLLLFSLFSFGVFQSMRVDTKYQFILYLFLLISPVTALLIERGNNDQFVFFLVVVFCIFLNKNKFIAITTFYLAFLVKFFPAIIIFMFMEKINKQNFKTILYLLIPILIYFIFTFPEVIEISDATPISSPMVGYGWRTHAAVLGKYFGNDLVHWISLLAVLVMFVPSYLYLRGLIITKKYLVFEDYQILMYKAGALIYVGTYIFGSSYDYRLIFLLLTLPFLFYQNIKLSKTIIILIVLLFWSHQLISFIFYLGSKYSSLKLVVDIFVIMKLTLHYLLAVILIFQLTIVFKNKHSF